LLFAILTVPVGNVLVGDTGGDIEHDDTGLAVDVVTITETTELLLASSVPDIELDVAQILFQSFWLVGCHTAMTGENCWKRGSRRGITYGGEGKRVNLDTEGGDVLLLELTSQVALDEGGLFGRSLAIE
jgi:hypothetical protein